MKFNSVPHPLSFEVTLPNWIAEFDFREWYDTSDELMALSIELSRLNIKHKTGGPFGSVVAEKIDDRWKLFSVGVNLVVNQNCSMLHAEAVALMFAQKAHLGSFDLAGNERWLWASGTPCIQCFGSLWWAGVRGLVVGARPEAVERYTGFNEGPLPKNWDDLLRTHPTVPMTVVLDVMRTEAELVLKDYGESGEPIYNAGSTRK